MILKEEIEKIANVKAQELNGCIVDVTISSGNDIVVYFDKIGGVQIKAVSYTHLTLPTKA